MEEYNSNITYVAVQKNTHSKAKVCSRVVQLHITRSEIVYEITEATKRSSSRNFQQKNSILYIFFWVFPRRQIVVGRRFGTLYQFHLQRLGVHCTLYTQPLKMELIQGSETSANYNLTPGKYPE